MAKTLFESWDGCYDGNWNGLIVPDAFAHPAKYAHGLIDRIFRYMLREDMLRRGDVVVDPFGGIASGGIVAASLGLQWYGCELERKFWDLGNLNIELHRDKWRQCGDPIPVLVNGDSRKLRENLAGVLAAGVVCSPPFTGIVATGDPDWLTPGEQGKRNPSKSNQADYGTTPGQLGAMKAGDVSAVVSSPPFCDGGMGDKRPFGGIAEKKEHWNETTGPGGLTDYGSTPGQLGAMKAGDVAAVVSSPPYAECLQGDNTAKETAEESLAKRNTEGGPLGQSCRHKGYGSAENLGNLKGGSVDAVVTSPPYEGSEVASACKSQHPDGRQATYKRKDGLNGYADNSDGQLATQTGETFWHAARDIVSECHAILRPGGWSAWVVKNFVRNKQIVPFCDDWCKLLEACGFEVKLRVHAMLVKETSHPDLFGGEDHIERTERKSFFRRLAEKKGSPPIDFEEVVFARKPLFPNPA